MSWISIGFSLLPLLLMGCAGNDSKQALPHTPAQHGMCYVHRQRLERASASDPEASLALFNYWSTSPKFKGKRKAVLDKAFAAGHPWAVESMKSGKS